MKFGSKIIVATIGWILMTFPLAPPAGWIFLSPWDIIIIFIIICRLAQSFVQTFMVPRERPSIWWSLKFPPGTTMRSLIVFWGEMWQWILNKYNFVHMFMSPSGWSQYARFLKHDYGNFPTVGGIVCIKMFQIGFPEQSEEQLQKQTLLLYGLQSISVWCFWRHKDFYNIYVITLTHGILCLLSEGETDVSYLLCWQNKRLN